MSLDTAVCVTRLLRTQQQIAPEELSVGAAGKLSYVCNRGIGVCSFGTTAAVAPGFLENDTTEQQEKLNR